MRVYAYFKKENGFTLVYSIFLIIIVLTLIAVLVNIAISEYLQAEKNKNATKAYFLARSGAEIMADYIYENGNSALLEIDDFITNEKLMEFKNQDDKISSIKVLKDSEDRYNIISTAEVSGEEKSVIAVIAKTVPDFKDVAIFAKSNLDFSKMDDLDIASGKVVTNGDSIEDPDEFIKNEEQKITNANLDFPPIIWDENETIQLLVTDEPDGKDIINDKISSSGYYKDIKYNNGTLEIEFPEGQNVVNIAVNNFELKTNLIFGNYDPEIDTDKRINIYIKNSVTFQTPNVNLPNINFFLNEGSTMTLIANSNIPDDEGIFVYGPDSDFIMQSNKTTYGGAIIVDSFEGQGNLAMGNFIYEAFSDEDLEYIESVIKENAKYVIVNWERN